MINEIPEVLNNFEVYDEDAKRLLGLADATLPELNQITAEISGAGLGGKIDFPVLGQFESLELGLTWRTIYERPLRLMQPHGKVISLRGAVQNYDAGSGQIKIDALRVDCRILSKGLNLGKFTAAEQMESESTFTVDYIKISVNDRAYLEIDFFNYKFVVDGVDYLTDVRSALGLS